MRLDRLQDLLTAKVEIMFRISPLLPVSLTLCFLGGVLALVTGVSHVLLAADCGHDASNSSGLKLTPMRSVKLEP